MEIKVFNNVFENKYETFEYDTSKPLLEQVEKYINKETYRETLVECYDPQTGETFYAPMYEEEIENPSVMIIANGKNVDKNYVPKEGELVSVVFLPTNERAGEIVRGAILGAAVGLAVAAFVVITGGAALAALPTMPWMIGGLGILGAAAGAYLGNELYERNQANNSAHKYIDKGVGSSSPDVRGSENSSIKGNNFPFVIGKHLVTPFIVGDPVTEYSGPTGEDAYIRELLCVGYAPLKLTDFKLGEFWLAYNRSHQIGDGSTVQCDTYLAGLLKGYSSGGTPDNGDILDYWKNNDVELEIIQQPESGNVNYGTIYTSTYDDQSVNANVFYVADKALDESAQVVYKGVSFPNKFRTNGCWFTAPCPMQFTVNIGFPSGLYRTYSKTEGNVTTTEYDTIPMWVCAQWRIYNVNNPSPKADGSDFNLWNTLAFPTPDGQHTYSGTFSSTEATFDKNRHRGNDLSTVSINDVYGDFIGKTLQNFTSIGGEDGLSEIRLSKTVTLTKEQCKELIADTNPGRLIEVRILRVSPNYINETQNRNEHIGAENYSDHLKVYSIVTKIFDEEKLRKEDVLTDVKPLSDDDYKKLCLVAIKAKADASGYLSQQLKSINCMAESFSPVWNSTTHEVEPAGIQNVTKYYGYFKNGQRVDRSSEDDVTETEVTKSEYEQARQDGIDWYCEDCGTNYRSIMDTYVFSNAVTHNEQPGYILNQSASKFNDNLASSGFLLGCVGPQNGPMSISYENINMAKVGEWAEKIVALKDGSTFDVATTYNGVEYDAGDEIPVRMEANAYIYAATKLEDLLQKLAFCGRAVWYADENGKISIIMDGPVDYTKGVINAQNCISSSNAFSYAEPPAGLFISFSDENDGYETNQFYCWSDGNKLTNYHGQVEPYSVEFVTNPYQMWSLGRYILALRELNREVLTRKIGPEGVTYNLGDVVLLQSEDLLIGDCSGRVQEVIEDDEKIYGFVCDAPFVFDAEQSSEDQNSTQGVTIMQPRYAGKSNAITYPISMPRTQDADGKSFTLQKGTTNVVLFPEGGVVKGDNDPSPTNTVKCNIKTGDICMFGIRDKISAPYRITKLKPEKDGSFTETLIPYDEGLYNAGDKIPSFQNYMTPPAVEDPPITLSETPSTLIELNQSQEFINMRIDGVIDGDEIGNPDEPVWTSATAQQNGINLVWQPISQSGLNNALKRYTIQISKDNGETWTDFTSTTENNSLYVFSGNELYMESSDMTGWKFQIRAENVYGKVSDWVEITVDRLSYKTWVPPAPTNVVATAYKDYIRISWSFDNSSVYGTNRFTIKKNDVAITELGTYHYDYYFVRANGEYPEASDFANTAWEFKVEVTNESTATKSGNISSATASYNTTNYGTWIIPPVSVNLEVLDRTAVLTALYHSNIEVYGTTQTLLKIKRLGNTDTGDSSQTYNNEFVVTPDSSYFTPEFNRNVMRTTSADNTENGDTEFNYRAYDNGLPKTSYYISNSNKITHTLPLIGQNPRFFREGNIPLTRTVDNKTYPIFEWDSSVEQVTVVPISPTEGEIIHYNGSDEIVSGVVIFARGGYYICDGTLVTPAGTENPEELGWYELDDGHYVKTTDTTVVAGTDYYEVEWNQLFAKSLAVPTSYEYVIGMTNESYPVVSGEKTGSFASPVTAVALPTNISDIVHSHEHYKDLYVEKLSAITANVGLIQQGGMGSFADKLNYWALSDMYPEDTGVPEIVRKGAFRVGGANEYFKVTPQGNDNYKIELKAGNIELTTDVNGESVMDFQKGTYIYNNERTLRLKLSSEGIVIQRYSGTDTDKWADATKISNVSKVITDENSNMIITNTEDIPPIGYQVDGDIYHFKGTATESDGGGNPQSISVSGEIVATNDLNPIISPNSSETCYKGMITKTITNWTGNVVYLSKSNIIGLGNQGLQFDGTLETVPDPLTGFNEAMKETSTIDDSMTVGEYLGLSDTQVSMGIFY